MAITPNSIRIPSFALFKKGTSGYWRKFTYNALQSKNTLLNSSQNYMDLFKEISEWFYKKYCKIQKNKADFIFYKIVDKTDKKLYSLQCINTNAIFNASLSEIVFDFDILHRLHPIQACYIGIEYGRCTNNSNDNTKNKKLQECIANNYNSVHYGNYQLCYQNREGKLCFIDTTTNEEYLMDPRDIALTDKLISNFDSSQAFFIGLNAGMRINKIIQSNVKKPYLYIIK